MRRKLLNINYLWNIVRKMEVNRQEKCIIGSAILKINTEKWKHQNTRYCLELQRGQEFLIKINYNKNIKISR